MNKNIKKILFGIGVSASALGASAFTSDEAEVAKLTQVKEGLIVSNFLVNKGTEFSPRASVNPSAECKATDPRDCAYTVTAEGMDNIPDQPSYSLSQIDQYVDEGWVEPHPNSSPALYSN